MVSGLWLAVRACIMYYVVRQGKATRREAVRLDGSGFPRLYYAVLDWTKAGCEPFVEIVTVLFPTTSVRTTYAVRSVRS